MKYLRSIGIGFLVLLSKFLPFNWIIGSYHLTFSWTTMMAPVITQQFGLSWMSLFFVSSKLLFSASFFLSLLHRTPLFFAACAFKQRTAATSILLPALCMILFVTHDVGSVAWVYSLYWLIPMGLFFVKNSIIARSLSASFVAHAVGSVIWLYCGDIPASVWIGLIPVVFCERLLMASGMLALNYGVEKVRQMSVWRDTAMRLGFS